MWRPALTVLKMGILAGLGAGLTARPADAQYGGYAPGYGAYPGYAAPRSGLSIQVGVGGSSGVPYNQGYGGGGAGYGAGGVAGYDGGGYSQGYPVNPAPAYQAYPSPARRQGVREGELYWETGIAPSRPLSPAEARGFATGERRAASTPWQLDPARQQGYREGQLYWETGLAPNRPLTPAEAQGFRAGENRAATGGYGYRY